MQAACGRGEVSLRIRKDAGVQPAAQRVSGRTYPVAGQQRWRQQLILQMDLAVFVNQQSAHQERRGRGRATRAERGVDECKARNEAPVAARELLKVPALRREAAVGGEVTAKGVQQQSVAGAVQIAQPVARLRGAAA